MREEAAVGQLEREASRGSLLKLDKRAFFTCVEDRFRLRPSERRVNALIVEPHLVDLLDWVIGALFTVIIDRVVG